MKKRAVWTVLPAVSLTALLGPGMAASAAPAKVSGSAALALAGVVAAHSPVMSSTDRRVMARVLAGGAVTFSAGRKISVAAKSVACRTGTSDIASRTCELAFEDRRGERNLTLTGRGAGELFAALAAAGVAPTEAAGSMLGKVTGLACTIDPNEIRRKAGGGADCTFEKE